MNRNTFINPLRFQPTVNGIVLILLLLAASLVRAQTVSAPDANTVTNTVRYRNYLVPADRIYDLLGGDNLYMPIHKEDFERLVSQLDDTTKNATAKVERGELFARTVLRASLEGRQLVHGKGKFELRHDRTTRGSNVPLSPLRLWLGSPRWGDGHAAQIVTTLDGVVYLRDRVKNNPFFYQSFTYQNNYIELNQHSLPLPVTREKLLTALRDEVRRISMPRGLAYDFDCIYFDWSLAGHRNTAGNLQFEFATPPSLIFELLLQLPDTLQPWCEGGLIYEVPNKESNKQDDNAANVKNWRIVLGGHSSKTVSLIPSANVVSNDRRVGTHQNQIWNVAPRGAEVTASIRFDGMLPPGTPIQIELESPLKPVEIRYGGKPVRWSLVNKQSDNHSGNNTDKQQEHGGVVIQIPVTDAVPADPQEAQIIIHAQCRLQPDKMQALPRIRVMSENVFHSETLLTLLVSRPLLVRNLKLVDASQTMPGSVAIERAERVTYAFQFFNADSQVKLETTMFVPKLLWDSMTLIETSSSEIVANVLSEFVVDDGDCYILPLEVARGWIVDSVKTDGKNEIVNWEMEPQTSNRLTIQWRRAITPTKPVSVQISAHLLSVPESFTLETLQPIRLTGRSGGTHLISIDPSSLYRFREGRNVPYLVSRLALPTFMSQAMVNYPGYSFLPLNSETYPLQLALETSKLSYTGQIDGTLMMYRDVTHNLPKQSIDRVTQTYKFRCTPVDSHIERTTICFSPMDDEAWEWQVTESDEKPFQVEKIMIDADGVISVLTGNENQLPPLCRRGYRIQFSVPRNTPYEITASRTLPLEKSRIVPLAMLPRAASQTVELAIDSRMVTDVNIVNNRLTAIPVPAVHENQYSTVHAAFRYDARREYELMTASTTEPALELIPDSNNTDNVQTANEPPRQNACVWSLQLDSQYQADGSVRNNAAFLIENKGRESVQITLPRNVGQDDVMALWVDDNRVTWQPELSNVDNDKSVKISVELPNLRRFVAVSIEYNYRDIPLTQQRKIRPNYPAVDLPVISGNWTTWFPPGYEVSERRTFSETRKNARSERIVALRWIFGDFNPFTPNSWKKLFGEDSNKEVCNVLANRFLRILGNSSATKKTDTAVPSTTSATAPRLNYLSYSDTNIVPALTWGESFHGDAATIEQLIKSNKEDDEAAPLVTAAVTRILFRIDRRSLTWTGVTPATPLPVLSLNPDDPIGNGYRILEKSGLSVIIFRSNDSLQTNSQTNTYTILLTSALTTSQCRDSLFNLVGEHIWMFVPRREAIVENKGKPLTLEQQLALLPRGSQCITVQQWINDTSGSDALWPSIRQAARFAAPTSGWTAIDMTRSDSEKSLYIVYRDTIAAYGAIAFLSIFVLTLRKPASHPLFLVVLMFVFEIIARNVAPCYIAIPVGAFLGTLCSFTFALIRPKRTAFSSLNNRPASRVIRRLQDDDSSEDVPFTIGVDNVTESYPPHISRDKDKERRHNTKSSADGSTIEPQTLWSLLLAFVSTPFYLSIIIVTMLMIFFARSASSREWLTDNVAATVPVQSLTNLQTPKIGTNEQPKEIPPYRVYIPVDEQLRPADDHVWISPEFLRTLYRETRKDSRGGRHWGITRAEYQGTLMSNPMQQSLYLSDLRAIYNIKLDENTATILIPLTTESVLWDRNPIQPTWQFIEPTSITSPVRAEDSLSFTVENQQVGEHQLDLVLPTEAKRVDDQTGVSIWIPRVPGATLKLNVPHDTPPLLVQETLGAVFTNSQNSLALTAELGMTDRLQFSWQERPSRDHAAVVDQTFLLRAMPNQAEFQSRFRYDAGNGQLRYLTIATDTQLQRWGQYRLYVDGQPVDFVESVNDSNVNDPTIPPYFNLTRITLKTPVSGMVTLAADYIVKGFRGVGSLQLPRITAAQVARIERSWLAVTVDPTLTLSLDSVESDNEILRAFPSAWQSQTTPSTSSGLSSLPTAAVSDSSTTSTSTKPRQPIEPIVAFDLKRIKPDGILSIRKSAAPLEVKWLQSLLFGVNEIQLHGVAAITSTNETYQYIACVPERFEIDELKLVDETGNAIDCRWILSRTADKSTVQTDSKTRKTSYTIFIKRPIIGKATLTVRGRLPISPFSQPPLVPHNIPSLALDNSVTVEDNFDIYRTNGIVFSMPEGLSDWQPREDAVRHTPPFNDAISLGEFVKKTLPAAVDGAATSTPSSTETVVTSQTKLLEHTVYPSFMLTPNKPNVYGTQTTTFYHKQRNRTNLSDNKINWEVTSIFQLNVEHGEVDTLLVRLDKQCRNVQVSKESSLLKFSVEPKTDYSLLRLTFAKPLSGAVAFNVTADVNLPALPRIDIDFESSRVRQFVVLSNEFLSERYEWTVEQLSPLDPETSQTVLQDNTLFEHEEYDVNDTESLQVLRNTKSVYAIAGRLYSAVVSPPGEGARITFADLTIYIRKDGSLYGVSSYDLRSGGQRRAVLTLPAGFSLIEISSGSNSFPIEHSEDNSERYAIELWNNLPQRIDVVFAGRVNVPLTLNRWSKEMTAVDIPLPMFEGITADETLWEMCFETSDSLPSFAIAASSIPRLTKSSDVTATDLVVDKFKAERPYIDNVLLLQQIQVNFARLKNLLQSASQLVSSAEIDSDKRRCFVSWDRRWWELKKEIDSLLNSYQASGYNTPAVSPRIGVQSSVTPIIDYISSLTPTHLSNAGQTESQMFTKKQKELDTLHDSIVETLGFESTDIDLHNSIRLSSHPSALWQASHFEDDARLFGVTGGTLISFTIQPQATQHNLIDSVPFHYGIWIILFSTAAMLSLNTPIRRIYRRFPYFCGTVTAVIVWLIVPDSWASFFILIMTFTSYIVSPWGRASMKYRQ
ncbi:MAG: hypothetical protein LBU65_04040 [Planctomycetaceae bacterium]|jgi:hypothetical protein|nr:hypothetical protein [Planctomycetaceae bacterium]